MSELIEDDDNTTTESTSRGGSKVSSRDELLSLVEESSNSGFKKPTIDAISKLETRLSSMNTNEPCKNVVYNKLSTTFRSIRHAKGEFGSKRSLSSGGSSAQELAMLVGKSKDDGDEDENDDENDDENEDKFVHKRHRSGSSVNADKFFSEKKNNCDDKAHQSHLHTDDFDFCSGVDIET